MKVLVTGAAGFIGSHVCEALLNRGDVIVGLDNFDPYYDPAIKEENLKGILEDDAFSLVRGDILDPDCLERVFSNNSFDAVIHLAAKAGVRPSIQDPLGYQRVNVEGTTRILEQLKIRKIRRLVFASSSSVYGNNRKVPYSESDVVDFAISPYAATKKAGEVLAYAYHHLYGLDIACLRLFTVYGPRQRPEMAIHAFTRKIHANEPVTLFGDGRTMRDYTYIDDIVSGICGALDRNQGYQILNLGESETTPLIDLVHLLETALGKKAILEYKPMQPGDVDKTFADITKACRLVGYSPVTKIGDGIRKFVDWYLKSAAVTA